MAHLKKNTSIVPFHCLWAIIYCIVFIKENKPLFAKKSSLTQWSIFMIVLKVLEPMPSAKIMTGNHP